MKIWKLKMMIEENKIEEEQHDIKIMKIIMTKKKKKRKKKNLSSKMVKRSL